MAALFQFEAKFREIVNLTVECDPNSLFGIGHWLMPAGQIDNGQSADTETEAVRDEVAFIIRTAMNDRRRHSPNRARFHRLAPDEIKLAGYTAHGCKEKPSLMTKLE
jgi:hypothetical protein